MELRMLLYFLLFLFVCTECKTHFNVSPKLTEVFGPGLHPDEVVLPVRYFFIEAKDIYGNKFNTSLGDIFKVQVEGDSSYGSYCRVWVQVLDRYDGTYIVRYRNYHTCRKTHIHILYEGEHVADSPYVIQDPIYPEECYCPLDSIDQWAKLAECPQSYMKIMEDLKPFNKVDMNKVLKAVEQKIVQPDARSLCDYVIKNNKVYRRCYGKHVGFNMFMDGLLHSMMRKMQLPDMEFIINLGDWPLSEYNVSPLIPIFSWCGSDDSADIVMPTYDLTQATLEMMGRVSLDILSVQSNNAVNWKEKKNKGFWRGRDSRQERLDLVSLSRKHPHLFNVSLTNFFFFKHKEKEYGPKENHESFYKFFDYKYQINLDGTVAAYRLPYLFAGSGVVFKQDSPYYEHFYHQLSSNVHYIPFKRDLSDLVEKINWAIENDDKAHEIGLNGRRFAQENLLPRDIFCYHALLFKEWSERVTSPIEVRKEMEYIPNNENPKRFGDCQCHRLGKHDEL